MKQVILLLWFISVVVLNNDAVAVVSWDHFIYFFNSDGTFRAKSKVGGVFARPVVMSNGTLVLANRDGLIYFFNPANGQNSIATFQAEGPVYSQPAVISDETVVLGSGHSVYFFNANGTLRSRFETGSVVMGLKFQTVSAPPQPKGARVDASSHSLYTHWENGWAREARVGCIVHILFIPCKQQGGEQLRRSFHKAPA